MSPASQQLCMGGDFGHELGEGARRGRRGPADPGRIVVSRGGAGSQQRGGLSARCRGTRTSLVFRRFRRDGACRNAGPRQDEERRTGSTVAFKQPPSRLDGRDRAGQSAGHGGNRPRDPHHALKVHRPSRRAGTKRATCPAAPEQADCSCNGRAVGRAPEAARTRQPEKPPRARQRCGLPCTRCHGPKPGQPAVLSCQLLKRARPVLKCPLDKRRVHHSLARP